jgi:tRNA A-37 threonylcarbamoyl transferase component Bud32
MDDPLIGRQLANYRVERAIKRGGMARVYYGWDLSLERPVAVKMLDDRYRDDLVFADLLVAEARAVARWHHPHIAQTYYAGSEGNLTYFVMEYVEGLDLAEILAGYAAEGKRPSPADALHVGRAVADALDYAHEQQVIHRDVKPANIMVAADGHVFLMDFGLAFYVQEETPLPAFGTARYIAPEQARGAAAVPQSDIYSLGVVLYEMLVGAPPFDDPSPTSLMVQHVSQEPPSPRTFDPDLNEATEAVLLRALRKEPAERYGSGRDLMAALEEALAPAETETGTLAAFVAERVAGRRPPEPPTAVSLEEAGAARSRPLALPAWLAALSPWLLLAGCGLLTLFSLTWLGVATLLARPAINDPGAAAPTHVADHEEAATPENGGAPAEEPASDPAALGAAAAPGADPPPAGRSALLFYDRHSFYLWNPNPEPIAIGPASFEAVDGGGAPAGSRFDGGNWAAFFPRVEPGKCVAIEIYGRPPLRPEACQGYNAVLTPNETAGTLFWLPRDNVPHFRLSWEGQEIGHCATASEPADGSPAQCEVSLP